MHLGAEGAFGGAFRVHLEHPEFTTNAPLGLYSLWHAPKHTICGMPPNLCFDWLNTDIKVNSSRLMITIK